VTPSFPSPAQRERMASAARASRERAFFLERDDFPLYKEDGYRALLHTTERAVEAWASR
jgi:hypothetical protein